MISIADVVKLDGEETISRVKGLDQLSGSKVLVTGAAGFLGSYLIDVFVWMNEILLTEDIHVVAVDNYVHGTPERVMRWEGRSDVSLRRFDVVQDTLDEHFDFVFHLASIASPVFYRKYPIETIEANVFGLKKMLELGRKSGAQVVYMSSSEVYGDPSPENIPTSEHYWGNVSFTGPRACYDESKRLGETLCQAYHQQEGVEIKVVRPFNVYGPGQSLSDGRIIPDIVRALVNNHDIQLFGDGKATRSFCYVSDFVGGLFSVVLHGVSGEAYNVGNDDEMTILELATIASGLRDPSISITFSVSDDPSYLVDNPQRRCPDLAKLNALGWAPSIGVRTGLRKTLESYLGQGS